MGEDEDESSAVVAAVEDGDGEEVEEEAHNVLLPAETIDRKESVELWKSRNETDVIVADHDVFGTDENDEDSLDSLLRYQTYQANFLPLHQNALLPCFLHYFQSVTRVEPGESFRDGSSRLTFGHCSVIPGEMIYRVPGVKIRCPSQ